MLHATPDISAVVDVEFVLGGARLAAIFRALERIPAPLLPLCGLQVVLIRHPAEFASTMLALFEFLASGTRALIEESVLASFAAWSWDQRWPEALARREISLVPSSFPDKSFRRRPASNYYGVFAFLAGVLPHDGFACRVSDQLKSIYAVGVGYLLQGDVCLPIKVTDIRFDDWPRSIEPEFRGWAERTGDKGLFPAFWGRPRNSPYRQSLSRPSAGRRLSRHDFADSDPHAARSGECAWRLTRKSLSMTTPTEAALDTSCGQYLTGIEPRRLISEAADCFTSIIRATDPVPPSSLKMSSTFCMSMITT
ncbi:hypothetical protein EN816_00690 [Mesorhizobium sp. M8A.F.Ca.ET.173.01.1.1]|nr:hypothetical protein EN816_00690 [Mesorhizobium sp. M8A.F.Ca.ET.173.01.1.1]